MTKRTTCAVSPFSASAPHAGPPDGATVCFAGSCLRAMTLQLRSTATLAGALGSASGYRTAAETRRRTQDRAGRLHRRDGAQPADPVHGAEAFETVGAGAGDNPSSAAIDAAWAL